MLNKKKMYIELENEIRNNLIKQREEENGKFTVKDMDEIIELARKEVERIKKENKEVKDIKETAKKIAKTYAKIHNVAGSIEIGMGATVSAACVATAVATAAVAGGGLAASAVLIGKGALVGAAPIAKGIARKVISKVVENKLND